MMKALLRRTPIVALAVFTLIMTACGSGGDGDGDSSTSSSVSEMSNTSDVTSLRTIDNVEGTGATAMIGQELSVYYEGFLFNPDATDFHGALFDSSVDGATFPFTLGAGEVIAGWDQGVVGMKEGGHRTLIIPSGLAYGTQGFGPIPPNTAVIFDIELVSID